MSRRLRQLINNQLQVKVAQHVQDDSADKAAWFVTLAFAFAGVFYFFSYYFFGGTVWRVLSGN